MYREPRTNGDQSPQYVLKAATSALVLGLLLAMTSCIYRHSAESAAKAHGKQILHARLDSLKSVLIALPADAESRSSSYIGSGQSVAHAIAEAFVRRGIRVEVAGRQLTNSEALALAAEINAGYVVLTVITDWQQRNEWPGLPNRLALWVNVVETATGQVVEAGPVKSHSIMPLSFTVEAPEALLEQPLARYVRSLY